MDIVILKIEDRSILAEAAGKLGLETLTIDAPWSTGKRPSPDRWIVVGRTKDAVWNQVREIERDVSQSKQTLSNEQPGNQRSPKEKAKVQAGRDVPPNKKPKLKAPKRLLRH